MEYTIRKTACPPEMTGTWDSKIWNQAETLKIDNFHPVASDHKPGVWARLLYDAQSLYVYFKVKDQYIRSVTTLPQGPVCRDSCVEFFFKPKSAKGYLNVEVNCGGTFLCYYIEDPARTPTGFKKFTPVDLKWLSQICCFHSLPKVVEPEITEPCEWQLEYALPFALIEAYAGPLGPIPGQTWQANFYKCGDRTSHPHWGYWAPIGEELSFHKPEKFAPIHFQA